MIDVKELRWPATAHLCRGIECPTPIAALPRTDDISASGITFEHAPRHMQRTAQGGDGLQRVSMCQHYAGIRKNLQETGHLGQMTRVLQQPAFAGLRRADQAQYIQIAAVGIPLALLEKP